MILDSIKHIREYAPLLKNLEAGLAAIEALKEDAPLGRYEFDGGYFLLQEGSTKPLEEGTYEAHRRFVDVQILLSGSEELAWQELSDLTEAIEYNPEKDAQRLTGSFDHVVKVSAGMFYVAFPWDGHKPVSHTKEPQTFKKIVLKLPV